MAEAETDDVVFDICASIRDSPIVCESVPGSVARRYRGIRVVSGAALVHHFDSNFFLSFPDDANSVGLVLTISNGSEIPAQPKTNVAPQSTTRGTLVVTTATSPVVTGGYVVQFLSSHQNAHDVWFSTAGFELHRLIPDLCRLKTRHPELFKRSTDRYRKRAIEMKKKKTLARK